MSELGQVGTGSRVKPIQSGYDRNPHNITKFLPSYFLNFNRFLNSAKLELVHISNQFEVGVIEIQRIQQSFYLAIFCFGFQPFLLGLTGFRLVFEWVLLGPRR